MFTNVIRKLIPPSKEFTVPEKSIIKVLKKELKSTGGNIVVKPDEFTILLEDNFVAIVKTGKWYILDFIKGDIFNIKVCLKYYVYGDIKDIVDLTKLLLDDYKDRHDYLYDNYSGMPMLIDNIKSNVLIKNELVKDF